ncbi:Pyruvate dehydrogenase E1 component [compost metagenome]
MERTNRLSDQHAGSYVETALAKANGPVIAATDYVRAVPELIRAYVPGRYVTLGTDGFGRSDTRQALREFFEVDRFSVVVAALRALVDDGKLPIEVVRSARERYGKSVAQPASWQA